MRFLCWLANGVLFGVPAQADEFDFSPFFPFWGMDGVTLSNDLHAITLSVPVQEFSVRLPGEPRVLQTGEDYGVFAVARCRAQADAERGLFPGRGASGEVYLDRHPDARDVATVFGSPLRYLWLVLQGREERRVAVDAVVGGVEVQGLLVEPMTGYSAPRAGVSVRLPGEAVLSAMMRVEPVLRVRLRGEGVEVDAVFVVDRGRRAAAEAMKEHCPGVGGGEG